MSKALVKKSLLIPILTMMCDVSYGCYTGRMSLKKLNNLPIERVFSQNTRYLLEMHPAKYTVKNGSFTKLKTSLAIVYSVAQDGLLTPLWQTEGVYPQQYEPRKNLPRFFNNYRFFVSNAGNKIIGALHQGHNKNETSLSIRDQSGSLIELPRYAVKPTNLIIGCGGLVWIESYRMTEDDALELSTYGRPKNPASTWSMSIHTGKLTRIK